MAFQPTHVVPDGGLPAWNEPDGSQPAAANLHAGTELHVTEQRGDWAQVSAANGWTGWVDARRLVATAPAATGQPQPPAPPAAPQAPAPPTGGGALGVVGQPRGVGISILLFLVTFGIYGIYWVFKTHDEIKTYSGQGVGGGVGLVIYVVAGIVTPFLLASEVEKLYKMEGRESPVTAATGAWVFPGIFIIVGPFIWFAKVQGALNDYWVSKGAQPA